MLVDTNVPMVSIVVMVNASMSKLMIQTVDNVAKSVQTPKAHLILNAVPVNVFPSTPTKKIAVDVEIVATVIINAVTVVASIRLVIVETAENVVIIVEFLQKI